MRIIFYRAEKNISGEIWSRCEQNIFSLLSIIDHLIEGKQQQQPTVDVKRHQKTCRRTTNILHVHAHFKKNVYSASGFIFGVMMLKRSQRKVNKTRRKFENFSEIPNMCSQISHVSQYSKKC